MSGHQYLRYNQRTELSLTKFVRVFFFRFC